MQEISKYYAIRKRQFMLSAVMMLFAFNTQLVLCNPPDADGDGISDNLDEMPYVASGLEIILHETNSKLTYTHDISADYSNLTFNQLEIEGTYGKLRMFSDSHFEYLSNESFDSMNANTEKEEIFTFTSQEGSKFQILIKLVGTNDSAVISKLYYKIDR